MEGSGAARRAARLTFEIESGGRRRTVDVNRLANGWMVEVAGQEKFVSVAGLGGRWSLLVGSPNSADLQDVASGDSQYVASGFGRTFRSYELVVEPLNAEALRVTVNGQVVGVTVVNPGGIRPRSRYHGGSHADGPRHVVAPMPGRIVKVLVRQGQQVNARQGLVVVEAMKMENELRAPVSGTVRAVRVKEGEAVEANAVLVEIE